MESPYELVMPKEEIMTYCPTDYKYRLSAFFILMVLLIASPIGHAQSIAQQQPVSDPVADYIDAIDQVEAEYSAYSTELSDLYLGLGKLLYSRQSYQEARQAFQRGMQVERVNYGLNSISQGPYLLSIADAESYLGNWDESQKALDNLYNIHEAKHGENSVEMLPVLDQMMSWYLDSYAERTPAGGYSSLVVTERIAMRMHYIMDRELPLDHPDAADRYRRLGYLQYFIANHIKQHGEPSASGLSISTGSSVRSSDDTTSHMHFRRGKIALERVVESLVQQEENNEIDQALALAELGDWYLVFGQRFSAQEAYQLAYDVLENTEQPEQIREQLFGQPQVIAFKMDREPVPTEPNENQLQLNMVVSSFGVPQKIKMVSPDAGLSKEQLMALRKKVRQQRYRPRLEAGLTQEAQHTIILNNPMLSE